MENTIEGRNPVLEALRAERPIRKIMLSKSVERHGVIAEILHLAGTRGIPVEYVEKAAIDRLAQSVSHQGVIALAAAKAFVSLDELLEIPGSKGETPLFIILDGMEDPHNLGAILRTADASGVHGLIIREKREVGLTAAVEKASAGALEYVPVAKVTNLTRTIEYLKGKNIWIIGVDQAGDTNYSRIDYKPATAIVIGGEGQGLSALVKKACDFLAFIPMRGRVSSLNASVAAGVALFEVVRQREAAKDS
ncbi:MAG TPA: 23S rRNA (guanosine(2251)-2'-O)-methyltransferase RlmB [Dehalococcoidales bacterium]|nr:23S rRNA (guanosine(2251)-2'-O)-methyltransferase RlmB [Dehalococcoidales bacterium]